MNLVDFFDDSLEHREEISGPSGALGIETPQPSSAFIQILVVLRKRKLLMNINGDDSVGDFSFGKTHRTVSLHHMEQPNVGLQLRRAISIHAAKQETT